MEFKFENQKVKPYFEDFTLMKKKIGQDLARRVKKRYDILKAATNFGVYLNTGLGKPHPLAGDLKGCYGISISGNYRLIIRPDTERFDPASLKECDTIIVEGVMDYHAQKNKWLIP